MASGGGIWNQATFGRLPQHDDQERLVPRRRRVQHRRHGDASATRSSPLMGPQGAAPARFSNQGTIVVNDYNLFGVERPHYCRSRWSASRPALPISSPPATARCRRRWPISSIPRWPTTAGRRSPMRSLPAAPPSTPAILPSPRRPIAISGDCRLYGNLVPGSTSAPLKINQSYSSLPP